MTNPLLRVLSEMNLALDVQQHAEGGALLTAGRISHCGDGAIEDISDHRPGARATAPALDDPVDPVTPAPAFGWRAPLTCLYVWRDRLLAGGPEALRGHAKYSASPQQADDARSPR